MFGSRVVLGTPINIVKTIMIDIIIINKKMKDHFLVIMERLP